MNKNNKHDLAVSPSTDEELDDAQLDLVSGGNPFLMGLVGALAYDALKETGAVDALLKPVDLRMFGFRG